MEKAIADFLLGGETIGGQTLSRFYSFHVFLVPAFLFLFIGLHVYLVFKNGISEPPVAGRLTDPKTYKKWYQDLLDKSGVSFYPFALWRDVVFGVLIVVFILLLGYFIGAPALKGAPNPSSIDVMPQPDWYLLWIFALFALMPPAIESYVIFIGPVLMIAILLALPFLSNKGERHPLRRPWAIAGVIITITVVSTLWYKGIESPWSPDFKTKPLPSSLTIGKDTLVITGSKLLFDKGCLFCHQINTLGGKRGPDLSHIEKRLNKQEMTIRIVNGGSNMPAYGGSLSKHELAAILAFLQSDKKMAAAK